MRNIEKWQRDHRFVTERGFGKTVFNQNKALIWAEATITGLIMAYRQRRNRGTDARLTERKGQRNRTGELFFGLRNVINWQHETNDCVTIRE
jgi:hypothetical protein